MKKSIILLAACALIAGPAAAQSIGERTGINEVLGITPSTADFVKEAASSDMFEIQSSKLAEQKATDDAVKNFANQMVSDHTKTSNELKDAVGSDPKTPIPTAMLSSQQSMIDKLPGLSGADFTRRYVEDQVKAHKDAVNLFQRYAKGGDSEKLKSWAAKTLPILQKHLDEAQGLDKGRS